MFQYCIFDCSSATTGCHPPIFVKITCEILTSSLFTGHLPLAHIQYMILYDTTVSYITLLYWNVQLQSCCCQQLPTWRLVNLTWWCWHQHHDKLPKQGNLGYCCCQLPTQYHKMHFNDVPLAAHVPTLYLCCPSHHWRLCMDWEDSHSETVKLRLPATTPLSSSTMLGEAHI